MSTKTKKITWQVEATIEGKQWPISVETDIPAVSIQEMNKALESVALWFLKNNIRPQRFPIPSLTPWLKSEDEPMPERDAIPTLVSPECPHCKKAMVPSKHQEANTAIQYYCPVRFGDGSYCRWRSEIDLETGKVSPWQIKKKDGGK